MSIMEISVTNKERRTIKKVNFKFFKEKESESAEK